MVAAATALSIRLTGQLASVEPARQAVLAHLAAWQLSARAVYGVELVLEEILLNVALHAGPPPPDGWSVDLAVEVEAETVVLQFSAQGMAFDPLRAPERPPLASLDDARPGGLGLLLVRRRALAMRYARQGDRNVLWVTMARYPQPMR